MSSFKSICLNISQPLAPFSSLFITFVQCCIFSSFADHMATELSCPATFSSQSVAKLPKFFAPPELITFSNCASDRIMNICLLVFYSTNSSCILIFLELYLCSSSSLVRPTVCLYGKASHFRLMGLF